MFNYNHDCPFEAYITNLGKYNEGELIGEWVKFPTTNKELQKVMNRIGIGSEDEFGQPYEEWFITDYDIYTNGLSSSIMGEYANLDELNYLATRLTELSDHELEVFSSAVYLESINSIKDLINLTYDTDNYNLIRDIDNNYDLGYYYIEESGIYDTEKLGNLSSYIDYERFGRDLSLELDGIYVDGGFLERIDTRNTETYDGLSIPEEYLITAINHNLESENLELSKTNNVDIVYGYVYNSEGMHNGKIPFENTPANIASFIWNNRDSATVVTDSMDNFLVSSMQGGFLDRLATPRLREEVLEQILPLQLGEREANSVGLMADKKELTAEAVATALTKFVKDYDFYEFQDQEQYPGYLYDNNLSDIKRHNTQHIKEYLNSILEDNDNNGIEEEVNSLLKEIELYEINNPVEEIKNAHKMRIG